MVSSLDKQYHLIKRYEYYSGVDIIHLKVFTFVSDFSCGKLWSKRGLSEVDFQRRHPGGGVMNRKIAKNAVSGFSGARIGTFEAYLKP